MHSAFKIASTMERLSGARPHAEPVLEKKTCELHGEYQARHLIRDHWTMCPECRAVAEAKEEAEKQEQKRKAQEAAIWAAVGRAGIPDRFLDKSLKSFDADTPEKQVALDFAVDYADNFASVLKTGRSAILIGKPGTGKTHLACGIGKRVIRNHRASVLFITVLRAMRSIKDTWVKGSEVSETQAIDALVAPDLLILDEVGVQFGSDFEKNTLFDVLNERYERRRPTLFLSNLTKKEIEGYLGERVMDRLREDGGKVISFTWESHRGRAAQ